MVIEVADIRVLSDRADEFPAAVERGLVHVARAAGYRSAKLTRGIESPDRFVLLIEWDTVEAHTVGFRESELFTKWRAEVGPFFAGPPTVEHVTVIAELGGS